MMFTGAARAIVPETYETHEFESWAELAVEPDEPADSAAAVARTGA